MQFDGHSNGEQELSQLECTLLKGRIIELVNADHKDHWRTSRTKNSCFSETAVEAFLNIGWKRLIGDVNVLRLPIVAIPLPQKNSRIRQRLFEECIKATVCNPHLSNRRSAQAAELHSRLGVVVEHDLCSSLSAAHQSGARQKQKQSRFHSGWRWRCLTNRAYPPQEGRFWKRDGQSREISHVELSLRSGGDLKDSMRERCPLNSFYDLDSPALIHLDEMTGRGDSSRTVDRIASGLGAIRNRRLRPLKFHSMMRGMDKRAFAADTPYLNENTYLTSTACSVPVLPISARWRVRFQVSLTTLVAPATPCS